jgi:CMP-N-acetylneuraminic acid synthetase/GT2 family glycosyltransferase
MSKTPKYPKKNPKVSVIITAHNYGRYLSEAVESVQKQTMQDFEMIIVNDGSTDNTPQVLEKYKNDPRIKIITLDGVGLAKAANTGIRRSKGEYIIRLDADDFFDENILMVESSILDRRPEIGMVYPDYFRINKYGELLEHIRLMKVNDEVKLLDRSPLAAGAMYRRSCYDKIGGYSEELKYQEDYDFWIRFIDKFKVYNVNLPLLYYRQHDKSMSTNTHARMATRWYVKKKFVEEKGNLEGKKVLCVFQIIADGRYKKYLCMEEINSKPLMGYAIEEAKKVECFDKIILDTEDLRIAEMGEQLGLEVPFIRDRELARLSTHQADISRRLMNRLMSEMNYMPDIVVFLSYTHPMMKKSHIEKAINTMLIYNADSVISVTEDLTFHYQPGMYGLKPVIFKKRYLREEKTRTYKENGGIMVVRPENIMKGTLLGKKISHIVMEPYEAIKIESEFDHWVFEQMVKNRWKPSSYVDCKDMHTLLNNKKIKTKETKKKKVI